MRLLEIVEGDFGELSDEQIISNKWYFLTNWMPEN